jgi:adenine C2-methylase RlmN of 23S rRNA A2503 and tRNA A37
MSKLIADLKFADTPKGKQLLNDLTNQLFAIYNTLNLIGNNILKQKLYQSSLKGQVDKFISTLQKVQDMGYE